MTGFRTKAAGLLVAAALCAHPVPGLAQADADTRPLPAAPSAAAPAPEQLPEVTTAAEPAPVVVNTLGGIDGPAVGTLDEASGSLGAAMWSGASRADLEEELARIPIVTTDPVVRDLARRILLTPAETPVGPGKRALITIRLERLLDAGMIDDAGALASKAALPNDSDFARVQAEALLYAQREADICSDKTNTRLSNADPLWLQLRAYCYATAGDSAAADLTHSVMAAQGLDDPILDATLAGDMKAAFSSVVTHPTAMDIYLVRKAGGRVTAALAAPLGTAASLLAAQDARNAPAERFAAAEHILTTGALSAAALRAIADTQPDAAPADSSVFAQQSALRKQAALETNPYAKLARVAQADALSAPFHVFAALQSDNVAAIPADPAGTGALLPARVLLGDGKPDTAALWLGPPDDARSSQMLIGLDLVAPTPERDVRAQDAIAWLAAHATQDPNLQASAALGLGTWQALGRALAPELVGQAAALTTQQFAGVHLAADEFRRIDAAVFAPDRHGEAALLVLDAVGPHGPLRLAPEVSVHLVGALERVGLDKDARALAAEMLLFGPPPQPVPVTVSPPASLSAP